MNEERLAGAAQESTLTMIVQCRAGTFWLVSAKIVICRPRKLLVVMTDASPGTWCRARKDVLDPAIDPRAARAMF